MPTNKHLNDHTPTTHARSSQPDLRQYRAMHQAIRTSNERLVAGLVDLRRSARHPATPALQRWFAGYADELRSHHRIEDTIFFPALAARVPSYVDYSAAIDTDHHRLDRLVDQISDSLKRLATATMPWENDHSVAVMRAVELRDLMTAHLDVEDREILPMFERHFDAREYAAMDVRARRSVSMKHAMFFAPWFMSSVDADVGAVLLDGAPLPLKVIHRLTRRSYQRLVESGLGVGAAHLVVEPR